MKTQTPPLEADAVLVAAGVLDVPPGVRTDDFAEMEALFRHVLWPQPKGGFLRWRRRLRYSDDKTQLHYEIYDVPRRTRSNDAA